MIYFRKHYAPNPNDPNKYIWLTSLGLTGTIVHYTIKEDGQYGLYIYSGGSKGGNSVAANGACGGGGRTGAAAVYTAGKNGSIPVMVIEHFVG